jgi:hypothetical protein
MGTYKSDIGDSEIIFDGRNKSILVSFDIENNPIIPNNAGRVKFILDIVGTRPFRFLRFCIPSAKRLFYRDMGLIR